MPSPLHVAIWSVNTLAQGEGAWIRKRLRDKLEALSQALAAFFRFRMTHNNYATTNENDNIRAIFVAPEYFLAELRSDGDGYENRDYVDEMTAKSFVRLMPGPINTLLVPGSVGMRKTKTTMRTEKYTGGVPALVTAAKTGYIRNTAYGFIHSRKVLKCSKQGNATDGFTADDPDVFVPGWKTNKALLNVHTTGAAARQMRFGMEICADASRDTGGTGYVDNTDPAAVDVKILVSASLPSASVYHGNYTRALIHAAHDPQYSGIVTQAPNSNAVVQQQTFLGYPLNFYRLTLA